MDEPLLTVITVCLDRADTIAAALDSVAGQIDGLAGTGVEHLVVDGGSTDGTLEVVACHPHVRLISEPDAGLYDAMNKGVRLARGRYVLFLNSDDALADGVLAAVRPHFDDGRDAVCVGTDFVRRGADGTREVIETIVAPDAIALTPVSATLGSPLLNAKFLRRAFLQEKVGGFDLRYPIAADADLLLRAALARPRVVVLPIVGHHYLEHAGSLTINRSDTNGRRAAEECLAIAQATLARTDLPPRVRFLLRAWRGGKIFAIAGIERRAGRGPGRIVGRWLPVLAAGLDVCRFGGYLVQRKLRTPAERLAADLQT